MASVRAGFRVQVLGSGALTQILGRIWKVEPP